MELNLLEKNDYQNYLNLMNQFRPINKEIHMNYFVNYMIKYF